jgi:hypothetical protein
LGFWVGWQWCGLKPISVKWVEVYVEFRKGGKFKEEKGARSGGIV